MAETEFVLKLKPDQFVSGTKRAEKEWRGSVNKMQREVGGLGSKFEGEARKVEKASEQTANKVAGITAQITKLGIATALAAGGKASIRAFADFESGLIGVGKTANLEGKELAQFGDDIQALSRDIPVSTGELLELSQAAGQLGVKGTKNLLNFSRVMAELASASDVQGESGALQITRILGITNEDIGQINEFSNVLVGLGNNLAATESEILAVATRVAQSTAAFNLNSTEILGISGGLKALGVEAEVAGSSVQKSFIAIKEAIDEGGESLDTLSRITGKTREELQQLFAEDQAGLFQAFVEGLNGVKESGGDVIGTLKSLGIQEVRAISVLATTAKGYKTFAGAIDQAKQSLSENNARSNEAEKAFEALASKLTQAQESLNLIAQELGELGSPLILSGLDHVTARFNTIGAAAEAANKFVRLFKSDAEKIEGLNLDLKTGNLVSELGFNVVFGRQIEAIKSLSSAFEEHEKASRRAAQSETVSVGTIIDLSKGLAKQAKLTAQQVELSAKGMATSNEVSARRTISAIDKQIAKLQEAASQAQQLKADIDQALADINAGPEPTQAFEATDAVVKTRRASTGDNPEETIKLGREALEIINKLRGDGVIDDRLAKAQLTELKSITANAAKQVESKAEENIYQLEKEADKFKALTFGFDKGTVAREADAVKAIIEGKLKSLVPGLGSLGPNGKSLSPANFDTADNIIKLLPVNTKVSAPPALNARAGVWSVENLGKLEIGPKFSAVTGDAETLKNVKAAVEAIFEDAARAN